MNKEHLNFKITALINKVLNEDKEFSRLEIKHKRQRLHKIINLLISDFETKSKELDFAINYTKFFELIHNADIESCMCDNTYDALMITKLTKRKPLDVKFNGTVRKIQFKNLQPMALDGCVSISQYQINKYILGKTDLVILIQNCKDPNYYSNKLRYAKMYFKDNKLTSEGFQYYLIPFENMLEGKEWFNGFGSSRKFKIGESPMINLGLKLFSPQTTLEEFK